MGEQVYGHPFTVVSCAAAETPAAREAVGRWAATWTGAASGSTWARPI